LAPLGAMSKLMFDSPFIPIQLQMELNKGILKKVIDFLLYGNFWIAFCAVCMLWQTQWLLEDVFGGGPLSAFVFFSTLFLYAIHRTVGIKKVRPFLEWERFRVITRYRKHIEIYALVSGVGAFWFFLQLQWEMQLAIIIPAVLSLGYAIPLLTGKRRLRDVHLIKIFLIASVWAWVTVLLPALDSGQLMDWTTFFLFPERFAFIFAITIPFDIRDYRVDKASEVQTLPHALGIQRSLVVAHLALLTALVLALANLYVGGYNWGEFAGLALSFLIAFTLIQRSAEISHDYFFSGLLDGLMAFQFLLVFSGSFLV
jgi:4-hydroxybenzoate polyprenyltransferase